MIINNLVDDYHNLKSHPGPRDLPDLHLGNHHGLDHLENEENVCHEHFTLSYLNFK